MFNVPAVICVCNDSVSHSESDATFISRAEKSSKEVLSSMMLQLFIWSNVALTPSDPNYVPRL